MGVRASWDKKDQGWQVTAIAVKIWSDEEFRWVALQGRVMEYCPLDVDRTPSLRRSIPIRPRAAACVEYRCGVQAAYAPRLEPRGVLCDGLSPASLER